jgi:hypothetical protein
MNVKTKVMFASVAVCCAQAVVPALAWAGQSPLQRRVDKPTGAEVRVYPVNREGTVRVEIQDPSVLIRKDVTRFSSVTTIVSGKEQVSLALDRGGVVVTRGEERVDVRRGEDGQMEVARKLVGGSSTVRRAIRLLARLGEATDPALRHTARSTQLILASASGDVAGVRELMKTSRAAREVAIVKAASEDQGPGQCWYLYAIEAIAAYIEYEDCVRQQSWWELWDIFGCALIYDVRAIGAFSWWITCVGFRSV